MISIRQCCLWTLGWLATLPVMAALSPEQKQSLPPPASHPVDFAKEILPMLQVSCAQCHGRGKNKGDFRIDTRETLLRGGNSGPAVKAGKSGDSLLIELVSGLDPDNVMPQKGKRLTPEQVGKLRAWIDQDLPWPKEYTFARQPVRNLQPTQAELPKATAASGNHPVDRLLQPYYESHKVQKVAPVEDRLFARRAYLDVIGLLPPPEELEAFCRDKDPAKREKLVQRLLADNRRYAEHWLSFWNDLLRNDYKGTGYIDDGRKQITRWLYSALATNLPYDRLVAQLLNPPPEAEGFLKGIVWRGAVNSSQTPAMQAAQNVSQVFMGVNLKCASCHDSFVSDYTLADTYALANIFSEEPLELFQCDKPTGIKAGLKFLYPELGGGFAADTKRPERLKQLAALVTSKENGRLSRTVVNRLWARLLGYGLVEPVDEMDKTSWQPELLNWLAEDLVAHQYDLKHTLATILTSHAYQRPTVAGADGPEKNFVFRGPLARRLTAEQFRDALASLTGVGYAMASPTVDWLAGQPETVLQRMGAALSIVSGDEIAATNEEQITWFTRNLVVTGALEQALGVVAANDEFTFLVNGKAVGGSREAKKPVQIDFKSQLRPGVNVLTIKVSNTANKKDQNKDKAKPTRKTPEAVAAYFQIVIGRQMTTLKTDASWRFAVRTSKKEPDAANLDDWKHLEPAATATQADWLDERAFQGAALAMESHGQFRAAWVAADPLAVALSRPNREQVATTRLSQATTLQALELTNGGTLASVLHQGAEKLLQQNRDLAVPSLTDLIFERGLGRPPTRKESALVRELLGAQAQPDEVEDLLWSVVMLPEFQMIY